MPRNLFFDLDGTLTDAKPGIVRSMQHALTSLGVESPHEDELRLHVGPPLHESLGILLGAGREHLVDRAVELYRERFRATGMFENSVYPGVIEGLEALAATGRTLYVVTSKPHVFAEQIAEHFHFRRFFRKIYGSEFSGERSQKGDLIAYVLAEEGIQADEALMIGDRLYDMRGAIQNGVRAVGVLWGYGAREELETAGAEAVYAKMSDLVAALTSH